MIQAVLFDIDGVLMDSLDANTRFFQDILEKAGYPKPARAAYKKVFHLPLIDTLRELARPDTEEELERMFELAQAVTYRSELLKETPRAKETVRALRKKYALGIVSSRRQRGIERYFEFSKLKRHFKVVVCYEDSAEHKPHPEPLLAAAKRLGVSPKECVFVGDSDTDIEAGRAAGMKTILYGRKKHPDADAVASSFRKLPALIEAL